MMTINLIKKGHNKHLVVVWEPLLPMNRWLGILIFFCQETKHLGSAG